MALYDFQNVSPISLLCEGTVIANTFVKQGSAAFGIAQATAEGDLVLAVALEAGVAGDWIRCQKEGIAKVISNGTCALGYVEACADGEATTAGGASSMSLGVALTAAASDQDMVSVLLSLPATKRPANS